MNNVNRLELASDCAEVALVILSDNCPKLFPKGLTFTAGNGDINYTDEAQDQYCILHDIYEDIIDEHFN